MSSIYHCTIFFSRWRFHRSLFFSTWIPSCQSWLIHFLLWDNNNHNHDHITARRSSLDASVRCGSAHRHQTWVELDYTIPHPHSCNQLLEISGGQFSLWFSRRPYQPPAAFLSLFLCHSKCWRRSGSPRYFSLVCMLCVCVCVTSTLPDSVP